LYKSTNRAANWSTVSTDLTNGPGINLTYGTITTISVSPVNPEVIYVGTDDGNVWVSAANGTGWEYLSSGLPDRWVTRVAADPIEENTAYVTFSGYRWDEFLPHIFRTTDKGESWEDISGNLPESPVNDVIIDPEDNSKIYVASDVGVFVTGNLGQNWEMMGSNLPNVPVTDLTLHNPTRTLIAATYGRSMYKYDLYQDTLSTSVFQPAFNTGDMELSVFPNPFCSSATIMFKTLTNYIGSLEIYNLQGKKYATLFVGEFAAGLNEFEWEPNPT
jgi:hypothetical protein